MRFGPPPPLRHANFIFGVFGRKKHFACLYVQLPLFTGVVGLRFDRQSHPCPSHASMHPLGVTQDPFVRKIDALLCALDPPPPLRHANLIFGVFGRKRHFACLYVQLPHFTGVVGLRFDRQSYPCPSHASMHPLGVTQDAFVRKMDAFLCYLDPYPPLRHANLIFAIFDRKNILRVSMSNCPSSQVS